MVADFMGAKLAGYTGIGKLPKPRRKKPEPREAFQNKNRIAKNLRASLSGKTLLMLNILRDDVFTLLKSWLEKNNYFGKKEKLDVWETETNPEDSLQKLFSFVFIPVEVETSTWFGERPSFELAKLAKGKSRNSKIILFYNGTWEEFEEKFKAFKSYDAIYDISFPDPGYRRLREILSRLAG